MKNLILISILIICPLTIQINAQESGDPIVKMNNEKDAKLRFGIKGISSIGWLMPETLDDFLDTNLVLVMDGAKSRNEN